jgi:glycosyltransferase involved in cell wall biosynthesis
VKDQGLLLDGFAQLLKRMPDVHLDIIGADTLNGRIQKMAAACGVARHVTFHGFLPTDELVPFYQRSHVAIVTSRHEAAGVVSLEAAACGVPTVGTPVGYVADWTPEAAAAVEAGTGAALSDELAELLPDRARRARIAAAARGWALTHDADWTAREFERLYSTVAALDRGAARDHHGAVVSP